MIQKKTLITLALVVLSLASILTANQTSPTAQQDVILTGDAASIATLTKKISDLAIEDTYTDSEKRTLEKIGATRLVHSKTVKLRKPSDLDRIHSIIRSHTLKISVEENSTISVKKSNIHPAVRDPLSIEQWGMKNTGHGVHDYVDATTSILIPGVAGEDIHLPAQSKQGEGVTVAVLDTGVDYHHEDLSDSVFEKKEECSNLEKYKICVKDKGVKECDKTFQKLDTDGNGYPMDCRGWSMLGKKNAVSGVVGTPETMDVISHGSHVSGIIAAQAENAIGVKGVAPKAKILPVQVINETPGEGGATGGNAEGEDKATSVLTAVARGLIYSIASKANVVNLSLGWNGRADSETIRELVTKAEKAGIIVVAAAGNDGTDALVFPCQYSNVICVGAHGPDGKLSRFSNYGSGVDIAAPGLFILSTIPSDQVGDFYIDLPGYDFKDGTSMATPFVTGAVAVLLSEGVPPSEVKARLLAGARKRPCVEALSTLSGNLDIEGALKAKPAPYIAPIEKGVHSTLWERAENKIPVEIDLKNVWGESRNVDISVRLSDRDQKSGDLKLENTSFSLGRWKGQETKTLAFNISTSGGKVTSDITLYLDVKPTDGVPNTIRIMVLASSLLSDVSVLGTTKSIPVVGGTLIEESTAVLTFNPVDGKKERDYLVFKEDENLKIQILKETPQGYVAGPIREIPPFARTAFIRSPVRLDVNLDGKADYVVPIVMMGDRENKIPSFTFFYLNADGTDAIAPFTFENKKTTVMQLERYQWLKKSGRLVQAWLDYGNTPEIEKSKKYDPWNPNPIDEKKTRIYYHDPATPDGVRSFSPPKGYSLGDMVPVGSTDRTAGKPLVILTKGNTFVNRSFVAELDAERGFGTPVAVRQAEYRNLVPLQDLPLSWIDGADQAGIGYIGSEGVQGQMATILAPEANGSYSTRNLMVEPFEKYEFLYRIMGIFGDSRDPGFISTYAQSDYVLYYADPTIEKPLVTSLRRYNFLGSFLFDRSFYTAVVEIDGKRAGALQIPDLMGAYPGAEVIAPRFDRAGVATDLIRPAALRFLNDTKNCEWLNRIDPSANEPSQAVYFCGDHFLRIPYRL